MNKTPISYLQTDAKWAANDYSAAGEKTTIAKSGCGPTCVAMVLATLVDSSITPADTCWWARANGYKACNQGTYYSYFVPALANYGISCERINTTNIYGKSTQTAATAHAKALAAVQAGNWIICCMGKGIWTSSGHYILWYDVDGDNVLIRDPNSTKSTRIRNKLATLQSQVKYYWIVNVSKEVDDEVVETKNITLLGKQYKSDAIYKNGHSYFSPLVLRDAGFDVTSQGAEPIVSIPTLKINIDGKEKTVTGFSSNGTTYCGIRQLAEALGCEVDYDNASKTITIKK